MPTERFSRLSVYKQKTIREAAIQEFASVPFEKVSINKIIKAADISRGSFYTYFEDKRDLLRYIFLDLNEHICQFCKESIIRNQGSLWMMLEELLDESLLFYRSSLYVQLFQNVGMFSNPEEFLGFQNFRKEHECEMKRMEAWLYENTDKSEMNLHDEEIFHALLELCIGSMKISVDSFNGSPESEEYIKSIFHKKLDLVRYGVCKQSLSSYL